MLTGRGGRLCTTVVGETRGVMPDDSGTLVGEEQVCVRMSSAAAIVFDQLKYDSYIMFSYIPNTIYLFLVC